MPANASPDSVTPVADATPTDTNTPENTNTAVAEGDKGAETTEVKLSKAEYDALLADREEKARLQAHHDKIAEEKQASVAKAKADKAKAEKEKAEAEGNYQKVMELREQEFNDQMAATKSELEALRQEKLESMLDKAASNLAKELTKDAVRGESLEELLRLRLSVVDGKVKYTEKGKVISDKLEDLKLYAKQKYPHLVDGLQSTGGAGAKLVTPTGGESTEKFDPVARMNRARGIN